MDAWLIHRKSITFAGTPGDCWHAHIQYHQLPALKTQPDVLRKLESNWILQISLCSVVSNISIFFSLIKSSNIYMIVPSVCKSCLTLCDPMDCSTPGLPVHHQLPEFTQTHVHRISDAIQPSPPLSSPSPPALNLSQHQGLFQRVSSLNQMAKGLEFQLQHQSF